MGGANLLHSDCLFHQRNSRQSQDGGRHRADIGNNNICYPAKIVLSGDLAGSARVLVVAGDGSSKEFTGVDNVYRALGNEWQESQSWNFTPYSLKLFMADSTLKCNS